MAIYLISIAIYSCVSVNLIRKEEIYEYDNDQFPEHLHAKHENADEMGTKTN